MALAKQYVVTQIDAEADVVAVWGPFFTDEEATEWVAPPGMDPGSSFHVMPLLEGPTWRAMDD